MVSSDFYIQDNSDIENKVMEAAQNHYRNGKYSDALMLYTGMLNTSMSYKLYYEIGRCYYKLEDYEQAEEFFNRSIKLEKFKNQSYLYLGNIFYKKTDLYNAIENWAKSFAVKPDDESVCLNLATSYFSKGMKFQSIFYYDKYLKYARTKNDSYSAIKNSISKCNEIGEEFLQKAKRALNDGNNKYALEYLNFAVKNLPINFDINHTLAQVYLNTNDLMHAQIYLKQALCIDNRSLDVLQKLSSVYLDLGDYTAAYCTLRKLLPLVLHNQKEYLKIIQLIQTLKESFNQYSFSGHLEWAKNYDKDNNYHMALIEYENAVILKESLQAEFGERIEQLKMFLRPEERIIQTCLEKGNYYFNNGDYTTSDKYFSRVILLSTKHSSEYKLAKSRVTNA